MKCFYRIISLFVFFMGQSLFSCDGFGVPDMFSWLFDGVPCLLSVDQSCLLGSQEQEYIAARKTFCNTSIKNFIGSNGDLQNTPKISFCFSGGSYRAMITALGFLSGAEKIGLKDTAQYIASLSGSTWALGNYFLRKKRDKISIDQFEHLLRKRVGVGSLAPSNIHIKEITEKALRILSERGKFELADLWGMLIADRLFGDYSDAQSLTFKEFRTFLQENNSDEPFPLFTVIAADTYPYEWIEVSPFSLGSDVLGGYIPTEYFDSYFEYGACKKMFPERSLGWFLGMFGSAYNFSFADAITFVAKESGQDWFVLAVDDLFDKYNLHEERFFSSPVGNCFHGLKNKEIENRKEIEISDPGMIYNLPILPLLKKERRSDIIIVCDATTNADMQNFLELRFAQEDARRLGLPFPSLAHPEYLSDSVVVFEDKDVQEAPIVVYIADSVDVSSLLFVYDDELFSQVCNTMKERVIESRDIFVDILRRRAVTR